MSTKLQIGFLFLVVLGIGLPAQGEELSEDEKTFYGKFSEFQSNYRNAGTYQLSPEIRGVAKERADALYKELMRDPEKTGALMFSVFEKSESLRRKSDTIHFAGVHGLAKERFLPAMREIVEKADLKENYTVVLSASVKYIEMNGGGADVELLQRLSTHFNPGIKSGAAYAIRQIEKRESDEKHESSPKLKTSKADQKSVKATEPKQESKPAVTLWIIVIGAVLALGIVIALIKRK